MYVLLFLLLSYCSAKKASRPYVSGVRVENDINKIGFLGYSDAGEILVTPNVELNVVIFGHGLEDVEYISFTDSVCLTSEFNISSTEFSIHKDMRIVFKHSFVEWDTPWRICIKSMGFNAIQIDDDRTWIQTSRKLNETYFPPFLQVFIICLLFMLSSLCSGLNIGLMSLSPQELKILMKCGSPIEQKYAGAIYPVRMKGNQLLSTVIIINVIVNAAVTILFEDLTEGLTAFIVSSIGIVVFGEIIPQSICVKYGLAIGAHTIWIMKFFIMITAVITYPLGKVLDIYAGVDMDTVDRGRIVQMIKMDMEQAEDDSETVTLKIAMGAMELRKKTVKHVMTKIEEVFMVSEDETLDIENMTKIYECGYSRIPVYEGNNKNKINSLLCVSDLALIGRNNNIKVKAVAEINQRKLRIVDENMPLVALMEEFKMKDYRIAMVAKRVNSTSCLDILNKKKNDVDTKLVNFYDVANDVPVTLVGLVTLNDITEELMQSNIENMPIKRNQMSKKRYAEIFCSEKKSDQLPFHLLQMTKKFLLEKSQLFEYLPTRTFENLIQRNIREVLIVPPKNSMTPSTVKLYENGVMSKRFMVILEGKAMISFDRNRTVFEVGPWTCLGEPILCIADKCINGDNDSHLGFFFKPDFDLIVSQHCRFLQISLPALLHVLKTKHQVT